MTVAGYVTRSGGSTFFSQTPANPSGTGGVQFLAQKSDGSFLGGFQDAGQAINAFKRTLGKSFYQAKRIKTKNLIETYKIIAQPLDPGEIWGDDSLTWIDPSFPTRVQLSNATTRLVSAVLSGVGGYGTPNGRVDIAQPTPANQATLLLNLANFNGRPVMAFEAPTKGYTTPALATLAPPYTIFIVANATSVAVAQDIFVISGVPPLVIGDDLGGDWQVRAGAGIVATGVPISTGPPDIITVASTTTSTTVRVNEAPAGATANVAGSGAIDIGGLTTTTWNGRLATVFIATNTDLQRTILTERYLRERFQ